MSQDLSVSYTPQFVSLVLTGNKRHIWGEIPKHCCSVMQASPARSFMASLRTVLSASNRPNCAVRSEHCAHDSRAKYLW